MFYTKSWNLMHLIIKVCTFLTKLYFPHLRPQPLTTTFLFSVFDIFCFAFDFRFQQKHYHAVSFTVWLISLNIMPSSFIHIVTNGRISFFLRTEYILPYICTTSPLSIHLLTDLGCFHIFAVMNSAATNLEYRHFFEVLFLLPLDIYSEVELLFVW